MNKTKAILVACAVSVLAIAPLGSAFGQGDQRRQEPRERGQNRGDEQQRDGRNDGRNESRNTRDGRDDRGGVRDNRPGYDQNWQQRPDNRYDNRYTGNNNGRYGTRGRGAGPDHNYYVGNRLPPAYRQRTFVVEDWRGHQLRSPPRGYHWVQNGGDYLLVAITTGVILDLILNN